MTDDECEHGDPRPGRCALCRAKVRALTQPWRYRDTSSTTNTTALPRPIWFDAMVNQAREDARHDDTDQ